MSIDARICGYILWCVRNGFREKTFVELEQVAVHPDFSGQGIGKKLIQNTLEKFKAHVVGLGHNVGAIIVTTSEGNFAEYLYQQALGGHGLLALIATDKVSCGPVGEPLVKNA
ncbi:MAG: ribosomal protein S18 acetylase RimI-like enzyme [Lentisphaeria bacterium]